MPLSRDIQIGHFHGVRSIAFSPDGKTMLSGSKDGTIKIWQRRN
ncbi:WD40 repeat domain-containing protein [Anabaena sp. CS-542/02]|nr:WD40 repeat domain-containing protein [Anabaena sp. CS-542/02]MDB9446560.1 WD40 repeat domain-containing protein [Anabaena sp. CS-542/02]